MNLNAQEKILSAILIDIAGMTFEQSLHLAKHMNHSVCAMMMTMTPVHGLIHFLLPIHGSEDQLLLLKKLTITTC